MSDLQFACRKVKALWGSCQTHFVNSFYIYDTMISTNLTSRDWRAINFDCIWMTDAGMDESKMGSRCSFECDHCNNGIQLMLCPIWNVSFGWHERVNFVINLLAWMCIANVTVTFGQCVPPQYVSNMDNHSKEGHVSKATVKHRENLYWRVLLSTDGGVR